MLKSRLRQRRKNYPVKIIDRSHSGSTYGETAVSDLARLSATYEQRTSVITDDQQGTFTETMDVFWFEADNNGALPAIERGHVVVNLDTAARYDVQNIKAQGGNDGRLKVETKKIEWPI